MAAAPAPVAVVGPHFCAPQVLPLTLTAKITGGCTVADASGTVQLRINVPSPSSAPAPAASFSTPPAGLSSPCKERCGGQTMQWMSSSESLLQFLANSGVYVFRTCQVPGVWQVFRGDSGSGGDLLFTAKALPMAGLKSLGLDVFLAGNSVWNVADFKIRGDFCRSCYFHLGNSDTMIATMNRMNNSLGRRIFGVNVFPHVDYAFISVLLVILDGVNI
ncbi:unnamed protein product [Urochloa humidicola]